MRNSAHTPKQVISIKGLSRYLCGYNNYLGFMVRVYYGFRHGTWIQWKSVFCSYFIHPAWCNCVVILVHSTISGRDSHPIERKKKKKKRNKEKENRPHPFGWHYCCIIFHVRFAHGMKSSVDQNPPTQLAPRLLKSNLKP